MRVLRVLVLTTLSITLGASVFLYAQDEKQQEEKPRQEDVKQQFRQDEAKSPKQEEAKPSKQNEAKPTKQEKQQEREMQKQEKESHARQDQMNPSQGGSARPAGQGARIPDKQFHAHFGREHTFRANTVIVSSQPQFQYSGYTFELVDAWPGGWAYTDDCYIDYIDGEYFLFDLLHPGIRIAVFVVM